MVRPMHWHQDGGIKYVCNEDHCDKPYELQRAISQIVEADFSQSVNIATRDGHRLQVPAVNIIEIDALFCKLRNMANVAPPVRIWIGPTAEGPVMWQCSMDGVTTSSLTPWGAFTMMGRLMLGGEITADSEREAGRGQA